MQIIRKNRFYILIRLDYNLLFCKLVNRDTNDSTMPFLFMANLVLSEPGELRIGYK